jgi:hypothetical protein
LHARRTRERARHAAPADEKKPAKDIDRTPVDCVSMSSISRKTAIDNRTILFSMKGQVHARRPAGMPESHAGSDTADIHYGRCQPGKLAKLCSRDSFGVEHDPAADAKAREFNPIARRSVAAARTTQGK